LDITWYGHSCFRITERGQVSIVTDPYADTIGLPALKMKAEVVTISHDDPGHNNVGMIRGEPFVITGPGEYELGDVFVSGIAMHHVDNGASRWNVSYLMQYGNLTVLHLGDLAHVPDQSTIEALGEVTVALVPVGGGDSLRAAQAADVIALIEPQYIVPMHYELPGLKTALDPVDKFLQAMGVSKPVEDEVLRISASTLPEQPQVVLLQPKFGAE
jgi:L-ascorbate metabolism protein UlaG (beta-lactamase superfamily)